MRFVINGNTVSAFSAPIPVFGSDLHSMTVFLVTKIALVLVGVVQGRAPSVDRCLSDINILMTELLCRATALAFAVFPNMAEVIGLSANGTLPAASARYKLICMAAPGIKRTASDAFASAVKLMKPAKDLAAAFAFHIAFADRALILMFSEKT